MHILMIPAWYSPEENGTTGVFVTEHARAVASAGCKTGIIYIHRSDTSELRTWSQGDVKIMVRTGWYPPKIWLLTNVWNRLYGALMESYARENGMPDLFHAHGYIGGLAAAYLSEKTGIPFVLTEHGTNIITGIPLHHNGVVKRVLNRASRVVAVSNFLRDALSSMMPGRGIEVIPNPVDMDVFRPTGIMPEGSTFEIVGIGALDERKNFGLLIEAVALLRDSGRAVHCAIIGEGGRRNELEAMVRTMDLGDLVEMKGNLRHADIADALSNASVYVCTSTVETFGVAGIEAMACGVPVVTTPNGGMQEVVAGGYGVVLPDFDPGTLAAAITAILDTGSGIEPETLREHVRRNYSFQKVGHNLLELYGEVLGWEEKSNGNARD